MCISAAILCSGVVLAGPMGTAFTYQGRLLDDDQPANGTYEMEFKLYDSAADPNILLGTHSFRGLQVVDGYFIAQLDFGTDVFDGDARWLEIGTRPTGTTDPFETLSPRQELTPAPYALYAQTAGDASGGISGSGTTGYLARFTDTGEIGSSSIYNSVVAVGIGTSSPDAWVHISKGLSPFPVLQLDSQKTVGELTLTEKLLFDGAEIDAEGTLGDLPICLNSNSSGNVGIGTTVPAAKLHIEGSNDASLSSDGVLVIGLTSSSNIVMDRNEIIARNNGGPAKLYLNNDSGNVVVDVLEITGGSDLAEPFEIAGAESIKPGMVVAIDPKHTGQLRIADKPYDRTVAGIVSGANGINPGMTMTQKGTVTDGSFPIALTGRVYVCADASNGCIEPGDLLTTSQTPGHAMKVTDHSRAQGAILGKAMSSLDQDRGFVLVLVTLQ